MRESLGMCSNTRASLQHTAPINMLFKIIPMSFKMEIISYGDNFNKHLKLFTFSSQTLYLDYSLSSELN